MTYFMPVLSVIWYVGLDWPNPNCAPVRSSRCKGDRHWGGADLFKFNWRFDFGDILGNVSLERWNVNRLSHSTSHCES
jgi:hypothetical protein